mmetsp:Transcript_12097/g.37322  ORF Transcript_12097/g.37322 Transcript_12097/m.37322 type:complete len:361 (+) Transcript_12097:173-1255(+)
MRALHVQVRHRRAYGGAGERRGSWCRRRRRRGHGRRAGHGDVDASVGTAGDARRAAAGLWPDKRGGGGVRRGAQGGLQQREPAGGAARGGQRLWPHAPAGPGLPPLAPDGRAVAQGGPRPARYQLCLKRHALQHRADHFGGLPRRGAAGLPVWRRVPRADAGVGGGVLCLHNQHHAMAHQVPQGDEQGRPGGGWRHCRFADKLRDGQVLWQREARGAEVGPLFAALRGRGDQDARVAGAAQLRPAGHLYHGAHHCTPDDTGRGKGWHDDDWRSGDGQWPLIAGEHPARILGQHVPRDAPVAYRHDRALPAAGRARSLRGLSERCGAQEPTFRGYRAQGRALHVRRPRRRGRGPLQRGDRR